MQLSIAEPNQQPTVEPEVLRNAAAMFMADLWLEYAAATDGWIKGIRNL